MDQNLNHYKIFYEVAKNGNISKAAESLYISQPAVSKSITKLEQSLNHTLFIRSKKGVKLTAEGKTLYDYLKQAFKSIDAAEQTLKRITQFGMGQLRIGVSTSLCKHILLSYLQDFIRDNPHIKVSIECNPTYETIQLLKQDKIDIGLICETPLVKGYHFLPLRTIHDTFVTTRTYLDNLLLRERNPQTTQNEASGEEYFYTGTNNSNNSDNNYNTGSINHADSNEITAFPNITGLLLYSEGNDTTSDAASLSEKEILEKSNLMLLDKENISRIFINDYLEAHDIHPEQILEINNMDLLIDFAAIGMGVACVVREFTTSYIESGQVIEIPLDYEIPERTVGFIYNEHNLSATAEKFLDFCE